ARDDGRGGVALLIDRADIALVDDDGALARYHVLLDPAFGAVRGLDAAPMLELRDDLDRHVLLGQHPFDWVLAAGTAAQIDLVGMQADKARHLEAGFLIGRNGGSPRRKGQ